MSVDLEEKLLSRCRIAYGDLEKAVEFLEVADRTEIPSVEFEALVTSAIIYYARPFSRNEVSAQAKADVKVPNEVLDGLSSEERRLHERLIDRRNKAVAHAEWNEYPVSMNRETGILKSKAYSPYPEFIDVKPFLSLARKLKHTLKLRVADLTIKLKSR